MSQLQNPEVSQSVIRYSMLTPEHMRQEPFSWAVLDGFVQPDFARRLGASWPEGGFQMATGQSGGKTYRMYRRGLMERGQEPSDMSDLDPAWAELVDVLRTDEYREALARMTGMDLEGHDLELVLWSYEPSCWLSPHCDKPEKTVTQLVYMNEEWQPGWGGSLQVLSGEAEEDLVHEIQPLLGRSAILVRSDHSWHAVSPVQEGVAHSRRSLQIVFWKNA